MSKLSELLNPAPQHGSPLLAHNQPLPAPNHTNIYPEGDHSIRSTYVSTGNAPRRQSITSPLDALAEAATSSAPLPSPSRPPNNFSDAHQSSLPISSSRPTSSHASPPRTFELPPVRGNSGHFSPGLERYHQANSHEVKARRLSTEMMDDKSRVLAPLTQIEPEKEPLAAVVNARTQLLEQGQQSHSESHQKLPDNEMPSSGPEPQSPLTTQVRQTSSGPVQSLPETSVPDSQTEQVEVKTEMTDAPSQIATMASPKSTHALGSSAPPSRRPSATPVSKSITSLKKEASNRSSPVPTKVESPTKSGKLKATPSKKRAAPKKGTASAVKPPAKKRKVEKNESVPGTPALPRNGTPASSRASKTPVPKGRKQGSVTPARSSSVVKADEDEDDLDEGDSMSIDENEQFCICRGPDDHTWMIACDGGCDDWFHGRCVGMDEKDGKLIDKYICPNCTQAGNRGQTLWKPMCRLSTCRKPARVDDPKPSKYCSDEHGAEFMRQLALRNENPPSSPKKFTPSTSAGRRKSRKDNYTDNFGNGEDFDEEGDTYLRGGILRPSELKTLASSKNTIAEFRALGEGVLSPPETVSPDEERDGDIKMSDSTHPTVTYTESETAQLADIKTKTLALKERKKLLDDRETFLSMVKARNKTALDEMKKKEKGAQLCGFDPRLAWADEEFEEWRSSSEAKAVFEVGKLPPASALLDGAEKEKEKKEHGKRKGQKVEKDVDGKQEQDHEQEEEKENVVDGDGKEGDSPGGEKTGMCTKKRCPRHRDWLRVQTNNLGLDKDEIRVEMKRLLTEEKGVRERATIRSLEEG